MSVIHWIAESIARASGGPFLAIVIMFFIMFLIDKLFMMIEILIYGKAFTHVFDVLSLGGFIVMYILVLSKL